GGSNPSSPTTIQSLVRNDGAFLRWWFGSRVRIHHTQVVGWSASPIEFLFTSYYLRLRQK
ncbi:hypothetical protein LZT09_17670, partial [Vibrio fluvialis]|uniref:hypothetical protein n=1 Tax=Vibrio fluvialis TaxID=676 RepID=UPI001F20F0D0